MKIKFQGRRTGKSYDIALMMNIDKTAYCIQPNHSMKSYFCKTFEIDEARVKTIQQYINDKHQRIPKGSNIYIDELGLCMVCLFEDYKLIYGTYTGIIERKGVEEEIKC